MKKPERLRHRATKRGGRPRSDPGKQGWDGTAMRLRREAKSITRTELAAKLSLNFDTHVTGSTLARWEFNESHPTAAQAMAIAKALGCSRKELGTTTTK